MDKRVEVLVEKIIDQFTDKLSDDFVFAVENLGVLFPVKDEKSLKAYEDLVRAAFCMVISTSAPIGVHHKVNWKEHINSIFKDAVQESLEIIEDTLKKIKEEEKENQ